MIIDSVLGLLSMGQPLASFELELPGSVFLVPSSSGQAKGRVPHCLHLSCAFRHLTQGKRHLSLPKMSVFLTSLSGGVTSLDQDVPLGSQKIHSIDPCPPTACYLVFPDRASAGVPDPPQFRCWISRRVAPNMAVIGLKCNSTPWACSHVDGTSGNLFVGFTPGNFLQLAFPTDAERFPPQKGSEASHFAFALYITSTSGNKGRVGEELPTEQKDTGPTYVTSINGILLPFLLRPKLRPAHSSTTANSTLFQIGLPLFPREDSLAEALELPPLAMEHSFYMPVSAIRGLFSQLP